MKTYLGIEFGSTRIKAVQINEDFKVHSSGDYTWQSKFENGVWTYEMDEAIKGLKIALSTIKNRESVSAIGVSGMMHGYLAFDKNWNLLVPFRTWQNTITSKAADELTALFDFNIPQRWSIAHLYQAILNGEEHVKDIAHITTLAGYVHFLLTGVNAVGIGEASGIFPIDCKSADYNSCMMDKFNELISSYNLGWTLSNVLPKVLKAGNDAGRLTKAGAEIVDNMLEEGIPFAPPEGDAGTGMVATNSISARTGNVSAGTSIFSMVVLENPLSKVYPEIDIVTTPDGKDVAMVHCNNCTNDSNAWINVMKECVNLFGSSPQTGELYSKLYEKSLEGDDDCGGLLVCNYVAGEGITHIDSGIPLVLRKPDSRFTLANFLRATLYSAISTLRIGMEILDAEGVKLDSLVGHGGFFKTKNVGQSYLASACNTPVTCMETAGEGGPYGMAILASYLHHENETLGEFLEKRVFKSIHKSISNPEKKVKDGFENYMQDYKKMIMVEKSAVISFKEDE